MGERSAAVESVAMTDPLRELGAAFARRSVFVTGHTGFKGSWLSLWLSRLGARVTGYALAPSTEPSAFIAAGVRDVLSAHHEADIRDGARLAQAMRDSAPDVVLHLAAQPLVRVSYQQPRETFDVNVVGTASVLDAVRALHRPCAVVVITSDKCYDNREHTWGYRETDPLGGGDPYSASKGAAEIVVASYRHSFFPPERVHEHGVRLASARAGNVIGGGDWAQDRIVPDCIRALQRGEAIPVRNKVSTRPWQHVLEPLAGYLVLAQRLWSDGAAFAEGWNLGPRDEDARPVQWIVEQLVDRWGQGARWQLDGGDHPHEAHFLKLDISKARSRLGWEPRWRLADALQHIVTWHQAWLAGEDVRALCLAQIAQYTQDSNPTKS